MPDKEKVIKGLEELEGFLFKEYTNIKAEESKIYYDRFKSLSDAITMLKEQDAEIDETSDEYLDLGNEIAKMPKAVRCEDCEYSYTEGFVHQHLFCEKHPELGEVADDWFCADGWKA